MPFTVSRQLSPFQGQSGQAMEVRKLNPTFSQADHRQASFNGPYRLFLYDHTDTRCTQDRSHEV